MNQVYSEIGRLKTVLLHRPGRELENLTPSILEKLLFDDIPFLEIARQEHDAFANALRSKGVEVVYLVDLVVETLQAHPDQRESFINRFITEAKVAATSIRAALFDKLQAYPLRTMVEMMIQGIRTYDIHVKKAPSIMDGLIDEYPFYTDPMPNILFQRDPFASIGQGVTINRMSTSTRQRETLFSDLILRYHPRFKKPEDRIYFSRDDRYSLEGGDILVLNEKTLAIGISKRTDPRAIERVAETVFAANERFETVLALNIPKTRAFMHLDTVLTQIDHHLFAIHPGIMKTLTLFEVKRGESGLSIRKVVTDLETLLRETLGRDIEFVYCGGEDIVHSEREQWNDGANTLAVHPGCVIVYSRNYITNGILRAKGVEVIEIPSSELSRGRGGPRCMSMPIHREDL
ncbi:MAG: arginine deiminase [Acholeplasmatales bacterium]|nr:MAG: arginine deiminase [Acholeplasmatales bacterium]